MNHGKQLRGKVVKAIALVSAVSLRGPYVFLTHKLGSQAVEVHAVKGEHSPSNPEPVAAMTPGDEAAEWPPKNWREDPRIPAPVTEVVQLPALPPGKSWNESVRRDFMPGSKYLPILQSLGQAEFGVEPVLLDDRVLSFRAVFAIAGNFNQRALHRL